MDLLKYFYKAYPQRTIFVCIAITIASIVTAITLIALPALLAKMLARGSHKAKVIDQMFLDFGLDPSATNLLLFLTAGIIIQNVLLAGAKIYAGFTKAKIVKELRIKLLTAMSQAEWRFFINQQSGVLTASLMNEADQAGDGYMTSVEILASIAQILAYLSLAFFISWQVALVAIVTSLILLLLFKKFVNISRQLGGEVYLLFRQISAQVTDSARSIKSLKAMARESHSNALLDSYTKKLRSVSKKTTVSEELLDMFQEIFLMIAIVFTIYLSFQYLDVPIELAVLLVLLYIRTMKLVGKTQKQFQTFAGNISGYRGITQSIDNAQNNFEDRSGDRQHIIKGDIRIVDVYFSHNEKIILENASGVIYHNKLNTIVGASGAGKTTLVDLICGLYLPSAGNIFIDDIALNELDIRHWRNQIGYVVQENTLLNSSIRENVTLGDKTFTDQQVENALEKAHADTFISSLPDGIDTIVGESGANLSGGQRQRILIARALVHSPNLLILDEATSALDSKTEQSISMVFKELTKEITVISISHRPALVDISDNILELKDGKLVTTNAHHGNIRTYC